MTFGEKLRLLREAKGITQKELGILVGYKSANLVCYWETNQREPNIAAIRKIAKALDTTVSELFDEETGGETMAKVRLVDTKDRFSLEIDGSEIPFVSTYTITKTVSGFLTMQVTLGVNEIEELSIDSDRVQITRKPEKNEKTR